MATLSVTYPNFINGTASDADAVDQNFTDIVAFLNDSVIHVDGAKAMTGLLQLAPLDPTADDHAVRKSYMDGPYVEATGVVAQAYTNGVALTVKFATEVEDSHGAYNLTTGVFTAPKAGVYVIAWDAAFTSGSAVAHRMRVLRNAGDAFTGPQVKPSEVNSLETPRLTMALPIKLAASDTLVPQATILTGTTQSLGNWLTITWLHA